MKQLLCAIVALGALTATAVAEKKSYTLADLKALVAQKSYKEAVAHLADVAPSERAAEWNTLAAEAAGGYIAGLSNNHAYEKILEVERIDAEFPALLKSAKYTKARAEVGPPAFGYCFDDGGYEECRDHAWKFLQADPTNAQLAFALGKVMRRGTSTYWVALRFFKPAFVAGAKPTKAMCADDDLQMAVTYGLAVSSDNDALPIAKDITTTCWDQLKKPVLAAFDADDDGGKLVANACPLLKAKKALTAEQAKRCK